MYVVREIMHCKPGKVRDMVNRFKNVSTVMKGIGLRPFRVSTDVSGERYWTVVAEMEVDTLDRFFDIEEKVMANEEARKVMAGYHDAVESGRREVYKVEE